MDTITIGEITIYAPITKDELKKNIIKKQIIRGIKNNFINEYIKSIINEITILIINNTKVKYDFKSNNFRRSDSCRYPDYIQSINIDFNQYRTKYPFFSSLAEPSDPVTKITETDIDNIKDQIYSKLKEIFSECIIQMDPLKTYILIDWN